MKKFLFTLASFVALGFAANASVPVMSFSEAEITLSAGETMELQVVLDAIDVDIKGMQFEWQMLNPDGELMADGCVLQFLQKYGTRARYQYFGKTGITVDNENTFSTSNGVASTQADILANNTGRYVWIASNAGTGVCYYSDEETPAPIALFTVEAQEGWQDEYAMLTMVKGDLSTSDGSMTMEFINLKINNADYTPGPVEPQDLTGQIVIGDPTEDGYVAISYTGDEDVTITVLLDGVPVELVDGKIFLGAYGQAEITVQVTAEGYNPLEASKIVVWEEPVTPPADLEGEITVSAPDENGYVEIGYTGTEDVTVTVTINGEVVEAPYQLAEGENTIVVTVEGEGYNTMTETFVVVWTAPQPPTPEKTEAPVIEYELTEDAVIVTATGDGEVILYCDGVEVENPYTIARGETEATYVFTATAQAEDLEISDITTLVVTVPAIGGSEDPHMEGYWLVMIDKNGEPVWYQMFIGDNGDYTTTVALDYVTYGGYNYETGERPAIDYYFVIDGVVYGAPEAEVATVLGTALDNPLVEGEGYYTLPVGYNYNMGVAINPDGDFYVYAAQAGYVGVDELNANKTVAGVRYFNLAGQEMQEANGMTIVVTTYTDGTTSAVKVMK